MTRSAMYDKARELFGGATICIHPACDNPIERHASLYCSQDCYFDYPVVQAVLEKQHDKPLLTMLEGMFAAKMSSRDIAGELGVSHTKIAQWKKQFWLK